MKRTTAADLALPFVFFAAATFLVLRTNYGSLPPLRGFLPLPLYALAAAEFVAARRVRAAVGHDPHAKPMAALVIARCVALGKASSLVGAGVAGVGTGLLLRVVPEIGRLAHADSETVIGVAVVVGAGLLVTAGLLLERAGIDPNHDAEARPRE